MSEPAAIFELEIAILGQTTETRQPKFFWLQVVMVY